MAHIQPKSISGETTKKFLEFIMMQAQQIYFMLGLIPSPMSGRAEVNLKGARVYMGFLGVIKEKTRGNLTHEEEDSLNRILWDLQQAYAETAAAMGELSADMPNYVDASELEPRSEKTEEPVAPPREVKMPEDPQHFTTVPKVAPDESKKKFVKSYGP